MLPSLSSIVSQAQALELLRQAMAKKRLPHALIFAGPTGVGKRTTADALAAIILCQNSGSTAVLTPSPGNPGEGRGEGEGIASSDHFTVESYQANDSSLIQCSDDSMIQSLASIQPEHHTRRKIDPCGHCLSCRLMAAGNHPDFHLVYRQLIRLEKEDSKARELSAIVVRDYLIAPANLRASMNHGKVFIIEEAELMNTAAQNTLLKTLEEPPPDTFIILLTDQPGALLPTIRSRCQVIPFGPIKEETLKAELNRRGLGDVENAIFFAEGSIGNALRWSDQGLIHQAALLHDQLIAGKSIAALPDWLRKAADAYAVEQLKTDSLASKDQATHDGLAIYLRLASLILRQLLRDTFDPERIEHLCQAIESISEAEINLQANVSINLALMNWGMAMERELSPVRR